MTEIKIFKEVLSELLLPSLCDGDTCLSLCVDGLRLHTERLQRIWQSLNFFWWFIPLIYVLIIGRIGTDLCNSFTPCMVVFLCEVCMVSGSGSLGFPDHQQHVQYDSDWSQNFPEKRDSDSDWGPETGLATPWPGECGPSCLEDIHSSWCGCRRFLTWSMLSQEVKSSVELQTEIYWWSCYASYIFSQLHQ